MYRIDHTYEEYMSPYILPVCGLPRGKAEGRNHKCGGYTGSFTPSILGLSDSYHAVTMVIRNSQLSLGGYKMYKMYNYRTGSICFYIY